jgi:hypothetical protein
MLSDIIKEVQNNIFGNIIMHMIKGEDDEGRYTWHSDGTYWHWLDSTQTDSIEEILETYTKDEQEQLIESCGGIDKATESYVRLYGYRTLRLMKDDEKEILTTLLVHRIDCEMDVTYDTFIEFAESEMDSVSQKTG